MLSRIILPVLFLLSAFPLFSLAQDCPTRIQNLKSEYLPSVSLCELNIRYTKALQIMESQGLKPARLAGDLLAPRFINYPDWLRIGPSKNFNPSLIYAPAPKTWKTWESGEKFLRDLVQINIEQGIIEPLNLELILELHSKSLKSLIKNAGRWRTTGEVGLNLFRNKAISLHAAKNLNALNYGSTPGSAPLIVWQGTECFEDKPLAYQQMFGKRWKEKPAFYSGEWVPKTPDEYFVGEMGTKLQCGHIKYLPPQQIQSQLNSWLLNVNESLKNIDYHDPIEVAARTQRWFTAIHPFEDGNGRISRFLLEYILHSLGLPSPTLNEFDNDLYSTEAEWAREIGNGLLRTVQAAELCAASPRRASCQIHLTE